MMPPSGMPRPELDVIDQMVEWLEDLLLQFNGTIVFVSHDRSFIDRLATRILDLDGRIAPENQYLPMEMKKLGYETAMIGKWHLKEEPADMFDYWSFNGGHGQGSYYNPKFTSIDGDVETIEGYCTDITTDKIIEWIKSRNSGTKKSEDLKARNVRTFRTMPTVSHGRWCRELSTARPTTKLTTVTAARMTAKYIDMDA